MSIAPDNADLCPNDEARAAAQHYGAKLKTEMESIQDLIKGYRDMTRELEIEVAEFVIRDVEEQNRLVAVAAPVEEQQLKSLSDPRFLRWSASGCEAKALESHTARGAATSALNSVVEKTATHHLSIPIAAAEEALGWRTSRAALDALDVEFRRSCAHLPPQAVFVNGVVVDLCAFSSRSADIVLQRALMRMDLRDSKAVGTRPHLVLGSLLLERAHVAAVETWPLLQTSLQSVLREVISQGRVELRGDGTDSITWVDASQVSSAVPLRLYYVKRSLKVAEVISHGDILAASGISTVDILSAAAREIDGAPDAAVVVALASKNDSGVVSLSVIDVTRLSPEISFSWHVTWEYLCGISNSDAPITTVQRSHGVSTLDDSASAFFGKKWVEWLNHTVDNAHSLKSQSSNSMRYQLLALACTAAVAVVFTMTRSKRSSA